MDAVRLIQRIYTRDAIKKEWDERHLMFAGERLEGFLNLSLVIRARVGRGIHPRQQHLSAARLCALDDLSEVLLHLADGLAAQDVVGSEFENDEAHVAFQRPIDAPQAARAGVARNTRVDDLVLVPVRFEPLLQQGRVALRSRQAQTCRQAVAESNYLP